MQVVKYTPDFSRMVHSLKDEYRIIDASIRCIQCLQRIPSRTSLDSPSCHQLCGETFVPNDEQVYDSWTATYRKKKTPRANVRPRTKPNIEGACKAASQALWSQNQN